MNFLTRFGDRHDRKEKKTMMGPDRSQSVDPTTTTSAPPPLSPTRSEDDVDEEFDDSNDAASSHLHGAKRRTVSISRSGRYKTKNKERSRILSEDVYSGTTPASASSSPSPTKTSTSLSLAQPVLPPLQQPKVQPKKKKDLVKPSARDKSPARPYIILKTDSSVNFAIESTTL